MEEEMTGLITTNGIYQWSYMTQILRNG